MLVDRLTLLRHCASPPRYTGKLAAMVGLYRVESR
jgi:hypothetical protein